MKDAFADAELQELLSAFGGRMLELDETRLLAERLTIGAVDVLPVRHKTRACRRSPRGCSPIRCCASR